MGLQLARVRAHGGVFAGSDGLFAADQLQYLAWIREAGEHVLVGDRFDLAPSHAVFLHPMFALSGAASAAGLSVQAAYLLWKPVAVVVLTTGTAAYVRRLVPAGGPARAVALALALFVFTPVAAVWKWAGLHAVAGWAAIAGVGGEMFPAGLLWGYLPTAIAVGLLAWLFALVPQVVEADRGWAPPAARAAAAGLLLAWLHPWQGVTAALVVGVAAGRTLPRRRAARLAVPLAAVAAPLAYYAVLSHADAAWEVAERQNHLPRAGAGVVALALAPALLVVLAARGRPRPRVRGLDDVILVAWPVASLVNYALISSSVPGHALEGLSVPLATLGVRAWPHMRLGRAAGAAIAPALIVPGVVLAFATVRSDTRGHTQAFILRAGEAAALRHLRDVPAHGGVLTSAYLGAAVPAFSGRPTWVGHPSWTPDYAARAAVAERILAGRLPHEAAFVRGTGARFVVADCAHPRGLRAALRPAGVRRWGCASVYDLGAGAKKP